MANATIRKSRPKYLSLTALLFEIRLPLPGWVSILHRISGLLLFLAVRWLRFMLDRSLGSEAGVDSARRHAGLRDNDLWNILSGRSDRDEGRFSNLVARLRAN